MREILLNSVQYKVEDEIIQKAINPYKGKLGGSGSREYGDFSQADAEEYFDFRNGIGKKRGGGADARLDWSDGIDFTTEGQGVLNGLVNTADYATWAANTAYVTTDFRIPTTANTYCYECTTAGTSHATTEPTWPTTVGNTVGDGTVTWTCRAYEAPLKIIDFEDETYIISATRIEKWDGTNRDGVYVGTELLTVRPTGEGSAQTFASSTGGTHYLEVDEVVTDNATTRVYDAGGTDRYDLYTVTVPKHMVGTINSVTVYARVMSSGATLQNGYAVVRTGGTTTYGTIVQNMGEDTWTWVSHTWTVNPTTSAAWTWDEIVAMEIGGRCVSDDGSSNLSTVYAVISCASEFADAIVVTDSTDSYLVVSSPLAAVYTSDGTTWTALVGCRGALAWYDTKLRSIDLDGEVVRSSAANDVDGTWTSFSLTGNFGTVYDLFEGKLLSDGTPTIYFTGTEGLYSIDVTNEVAYKQEVAYPNVTYAGHKGIYWNAGVWVATGYGIIKVAPSEATYVGSDLDDGLPSGYHGKVYDFTPVNSWLVYCVNGGTTDRSSIFKRNTVYGGNLQVYTTSAVNKPIACLHHSSSSLYTNGRLWWGEGTDVKYMMFPDITSNVKQVATYEYAASSNTAQLPIFRKMAAIPKTALRVAAITKSCSATEKITVYYGLNGAAVTTELGSFTSSPKPTTLTFNSGLGTSFYTIQLGAKMYRGGTNTNSPELESLAFYYLPTPTMISAWQVNVLALGTEGDSTFSAWETLRDTNTLVAFYPSGDTTKTSYIVKITQMPSRSWWENMGGREGKFTAVLEEIIKD
uniref:Uncharacterized protein n=1 Tax=viral metagenome TaxID=1070528 RepID=A0A6M3IPT3_9ZZZZ